MIHINSLADLSAIQHDPELYREVASYLLYCQYESGDDEDDFDFNLKIAEASDIDFINDLGPPEEIVIIRIECCGENRIFHRIVCLRIPMKLGH